MPNVKEPEAKVQLTRNCFRVNLLEFLNIKETNKKLQACARVFRLRLSLVDGVSSLWWEEFDEEENLKPNSKRHYVHIYLATGDDIQVYSILVK